MSKVVFPTMNTCPNTLPYLYDGTLGLNMRLISSLSSNMFWRRISIHGIFPLYKQGTLCKNQPALGSFWSLCMPCSHSTIDLLCGNGRMSRFPRVILTRRSHYMTTWHAQRNTPCIEILLQNIFEDNDEIRRIFSPKVTVIEIRKRVRACIRRRE
ncbi:hypothetical protein SFRURICE_019459, partial [Spodoptera frugiperda]